MRFGHVQTLLATLWLGVQVVHCVDDAVAPGPTPTQVPVPLEKLISVPAIVPYAAGRKSSTMVKVPQSSRINRPVSTLPPYVAPKPTIAAQVTATVGPTPAVRTSLAKPSQVQRPGEPRKIVYSYQGCFIGNGFKATNGPEFQGGGPTKCAMKCARYNLFTMEAYTCDCGNKVMDLIPVKDEQCRVNKCAENFDEACGDVGVLLLYSATNSTRHG